MIQKTCVTLFRIICRLQPKKLEEMAKLLPVIRHQPTYPWFPRVLRAACSNGHLNFCRIEINRFSLPYSGRRLLLTLRLLVFLFLVETALRRYLAPKRAKLDPKIALLTISLNDFSELWHLLPRIAMRNCFLELFQAIIYILSLKKKQKRMWCTFWYKVFIYLKLKLFDFLSDCILELS